MYFISVLSCFTCHLSFQNRNEAVSVGWFPASEADRGDKLEQDLAVTAGLLPVCSQSALTDICAEPAVTQPHMKPAEDVFCGVKGF